VKMDQASLWIYFYRRGEEYDIKDATVFVSPLDGPFIASLLLMFLWRFAK